MKGAANERTSDRYIRVPDAMRVTRCYRVAQQIGREGLEASHSCPRRGAGANDLSYGTRGDGVMNPWKVLGVHRQSSVEEIRDAYLSLARKHHPDQRKKGGDIDVFVEANNAYELLTDRKKLSIFVKNLTVRNDECRTCKGTGAMFKQKGLVGRIATCCGVCSGAGVIIPKGK